MALQAEPAQLLARDCACGWRNYPRPAPKPAASTAPSMHVVWIVDRCDACGQPLESPAG